MTPPSFRGDFHLHTHFSDGTLSPGDLASKLCESGVTHFAITDHDSLAAFKLLPQSKLNGMKYFVGVEVNTSDSNEMLHILGFGHKLVSSARFEASLASFRQSRRRRAEAIVAKLNSIGIDLSFEEVTRHSQETLGRPNIADALVTQGVVVNRGEAFRKYLLKGKPAYVEPCGPPPADAIEAIRSAGGISVLAHPGVASIDDKKLSWLVELGLQGIEVYYPMHTKSQTADYLASAKKHGLFITCGSDYHGPKSGRDQLFSFDCGESILGKFLEIIGCSTQDATRIK